MELYASTALSGLGYALAQERNPYKDIKSQPTSRQDMPSMKNLYNSDYWNQVRKDEFQASTNNWLAAKIPMEKGMVPRPAYQDMFQPLSQQSSQTPTNNSFVSSLSGEMIPKEQFTHNNMQPFFRGDVKQNVEAFATSAYLENSTGRGERFIHKQEVECFFEPIANMGNVCGMKNNVDYYRNHIEAPIKRNNDFPIDTVRVGPGLDKGFTNKGDGGFQQSRTLDFAKPKTIDELRPLSRPKSSYELPFQGPQKLQTGGTRGEVGAFEKNRPDTYYEQSIDQWLKTTGAIIRESDRPEYVVKPTARVDTHVENITNVTSMVKAIVAPLLDIVKRTPKEYLVDAPRTFGNMSIQIPEKPTTYDPVTHSMRTTIKETTVHDSTILNAKGPDGVPVQSEDTARATNRETLETFTNIRNVGKNTYKTYVYDPEVVARTTNRQTVTENNNQHGYVGSIIPAARVYDAEYNAEIDGTREMMNIKSGNTPGAGGAYVGLAKDGVDMEIKKLTQDYMAAREEGNISRIIQTTVKPIEQCEVTKTPQGACLVEQTDRLDPTLLSSLKENPYNLSVNPIV